MCRFGARGINLGRVARVTINRAFDPKKGDVLYNDPALQRQVLYGPRRLNPRRLAGIVREQLRSLLGRPMKTLVGQDGNQP